MEIGLQTKANRIPVWMPKTKRKCFLPKKECHPLSGTEPGAPKSSSGSCHLAKELGLGEKQFWGYPKPYQIWGEKRIFQAGPLALTEYPVLGVFPDWEKQGSSKNRKGVPNVLLKIPK